jgi:hypothetical protein
MVDRTLCTMLAAPIVTLFVELGLAGGHGSVQSPRAKAKG